MKINVMDYYNISRDKGDMTVAVENALKYCMNNSNSEIYFPKGKYHFWPENAAEKHLYISNNDHSNKRITFPVFNYKGLTINGNGSEFIFYGRISPFVIESSGDITLKEFSVDYERPFFTQGEIIEVNDEYLVLHINKKDFPYYIKEKGIVFYGENWERDLGDDYTLIQEFDVNTKAPAYNSSYFLASIGAQNPETEGLPAANYSFEAYELSNGNLKLAGKLPHKFTKGNILALAHENRYNSGIFINESSNIRIENVNLYHVGAMGVIAQISSDLTLKNVNVKQREDSGRIISVNADATHFVNCTGTIKLEDCIMENMLDDATNIHGIYTTVSRIISKNEIEVKFMHFQQEGINIYKKGDEISFINRRTLNSYYKAKVIKSELIDSAHIVITLESDILDKVEINDAVENSDRMPNVIIRGCTTGNNRPRGFLISTPGSVLIEKNVFYNSHYAIHIAGDANYWFESGGVRDVTITDNKFMDCCYSNPGYIITIDPVIGCFDEQTDCYHKNIKIINNEFMAYDDKILYAHSVEGLVFEGNTYKKTNNYEVFSGLDEIIKLNHCINVNINDF